jgi:DNA-binding NarL/FixJ family response regulator
MQFYKETINRYHTINITVLADLVARIAAIFPVLKAADESESELVSNRRSTHEREILQLLAEGNSSKEIAAC